MNLSSCSWCGILVDTDADPDSLYIDEWPCACLTCREAMDWEINYDKEVDEEEDGDEADDETTSPPILDPQPDDTNGP